MADLGWSAEQALNTPMPWIDLALRAHAKNRSAEMRFLAGAPEPAEAAVPLTKTGDVDREEVKNRARAAFAQFRKKGPKHGGT